MGDRAMELGKALRGGTQTLGLRVANLDCESVSTLRVYPKAAKVAGLRQETSAFLVGGGFRRQFA